MSDQTKRFSIYISVALIALIVAIVAHAFQVMLFGDASPVVSGAAAAGAAAAWMFAARRKVVATHGASDTPEVEAATNEPR